MMGSCNEVIEKAKNGSKNNAEFAHCTHRKVVRKFLEGREGLWYNI